MNKEIERKYLVVNDSILDMLKQKVLNKIGIIQWYEETENTEERIRLIINTDKSLIWKKTIKKPTDNPQVRIEEEYNIDQSIIDYISLLSKRNVIKIRYIIKENPEIVLDEIYDENNKIENYYIEIETKEENVDNKYFNDQLKSIEIKYLDIDILDITLNKTFKNKNIATKKDISINNMINMVINKLNNI